MSTGQKTSTSKFHYAWVVCFGCALTFFCIVGLNVNNFSVYSPFIMKAGDYTKTQMSLITTVRSLFQVFAILMTAGFYKKLKPRQGLLVAGGLSVLGFTTMGLATVYPMYLAGSALTGLAYGLGGMASISMILQKWFLKNRTLAVSLVSSASGLATVGIPSLITYFIETLGLRNALFLQAAIIGTLIFLSFLFIRNNPGELSMEAYGEKEIKEEEKSSGHRKGATKPLSKAWWFVLYGMIVLTTSFNTVAYAHLSLLCTTEGYTPATIAVALSVSGAFLMIGKFVFGFMTTKLSLYKTSMIFGVCIITSTFLLCFVKIGTWFLMLDAAFYGFSLTMVAVGIVAWAEDWAQPEEMVDKVRMFMMMFALGGFLMGPLPGVIADACGGSYIPYYVLAGSIGIVVVSLIHLTYRKVSYKKEELLEKES